MTFSGESASGWQQAELSQPVAVTAGMTYVVSYFSSSGDYSFTQNAFAGTVASPPLEVPASTATEPNGVYRYGGGFPSDTFAASNYWADVVFRRAPRVTAVTPAAGTTGVPLGTQITATFADPVDAGTVTPSTVILRDGASTVPADVTYSAATRTARLAPKAALTYSTTYKVMVRGGSTGVRDSAGIALSSDVQWSFQTAANPNAGGGSAAGGTAGGGGSAGAGGTPGSPGSGAPAPGSGVGTVDRVAPRVSVSPRKLRVSRNGTVTLRVTCPKTEKSCRVRLTLKLGRRVVAKKTLTVSGGRTRTVRLRLGVRARRSLNARRSLKATVVASARDQAGNTRTTSTSIRLLAPRR